MAREPDETDKLVGENVRLKRALIGLSQRRLAEELGITPQQVQKYEKGINRIGASRLDQIAKALNVSPTFFFQDAQTAGAAFEQEVSSAKPDRRDMFRFLETPEGERLVTNFMLIESPEMRTRIIDLVVSIITCGFSDGP